MNPKSVSYDMYIMYAKPARPLTVAGCCWSTWWYARASAMSQGPSPAPPPSTDNTLPCSNPMTCKISFAWPHEFSP
jgi:hypothetical protein